MSKSIYVFVEVHTGICLGLLNREILKACGWLADYIIIV